MAINGLNSKIEKLSFMTVPYDYYGPMNYICTASGHLDRKMDFGLRKESPDVTPSTRSEATDQKFYKEKLIEFPTQLIVDCWLALVRWIVLAR